MILKQVDFLSPPITLYHDGFLSHKSIASGIIFIISLIIIFAFGLYYFLQFFQRGQPEAYFFNHFIEDAGVFPINSSSFFHFISLANFQENDQNLGFDFESFRLVGIDTYFSYYQSDKNLSNFDHWLYGLCNNGTDTEGISDIITQEFFTKSACIRKYFDVTQKKYFNTNEKGFRWPALMFGTSNDKRKNYGIIMEKCKNDTLNQKCKSEDEIKSYLEHSYVALYFMDQYADILNYETPFIKYLYKLTNSFFPDSFTINHLNFNPTQINSHNNIFYDKKVNERSYQYIQNEKVTMDQNNTRIIASFYFWLQNTMQYYERNYEKIQDLISNIGGIYSFVFIIATFINSFVTNYIIVLDTEEEVLKTDIQNFQRVKFSLKPAILRRASELMNPPPKLKNRSINISFSNNESNKQQSSIFNLLLKDKIDICKISNNNNEAISEPFQKNEFKKDRELNLNEAYRKKRSSKKVVSNNKLSINVNNKYNSEKNVCGRNFVDSKNMTIKDSVHDLVAEDKEITHKPLIKQNFTWVSYIFYVLSLKTNNPKINYYENFRAKVISEENMIQNHFNIFKLLNLCKIENLDPFEVGNLYANKFC